MSVFELKLNFIYKSKQLKMKQIKVLLITKSNISKVLSINHLNVLYNIIQNEQIISKQYNLFLLLDKVSTLTTRSLAHIRVIIDNHAAIAHTSPNRTARYRSIGAWTYAFTRSARRGAVNGHRHLVIRVREWAESVRCPDLAIRRVRVSGSTDRCGHSELTVGSVDICRTFARVRIF